MIKRLLLFFAQAVLVGLLQTACSGLQAADSSQIILSDPEKLAALQGMPATGKELYQSTCAACHGLQAMGIAGLGKDLTDSEFIEGMSDAELILFLMNGRKPDDPLNDTGLDMPPMGGNPSLTDQDLADIVAYIRTVEK